MVRDFAAKKIPMNPRDLKLDAEILSQKILTSEFMQNIESEKYYNN